MRFTPNISVRQIDKVSFPRKRESSSQLEYSANRELHRAQRFSMIRMTYRIPGHRNS
jgi:hypothetical protein